MKSPRSLLNPTFNSIKFNNQVVTDPKEILTSEQLNLTATVASIIKESTQNGEGIRNVIFFSGCSRRCKGCHNQELQDPKSGIVLTVAQIIEQLFPDSQSIPINGITLCGGEPIEQPEVSSILITYAKALNYNTWLYTGNTLEQLQHMSKTDKNIQAILNTVNVIVDGEYRQDLPTTERYKGSENQKIIHLNP